MSIAAPPEASRSTTHYRCKKDFVEFGLKKIILKSIRINEGVA